MGSARCKPHVAVPEGELVAAANAPLVDVPATPVGGDSLLSLSLVEWGRLQMADSSLLALRRRAGGPEEGVSELTAADHRRPDPRGTGGSSRPAPCLPGLPEPTDGRQCPVPYDGLARAGTLCGSEAGPWDPRPDVLVRAGLRDPVVVIHTPAGVGL
ncbi:unnamed protein product [Lampetra planeri]